MDIYWPEVPVSNQGPKLIDGTGRFTSALSGYGRSVTRVDRWGVSLDYRNLRSLNRARIETAMLLLRGAANRALICPVPNDYAQRGSFAAGELVPNNTFSAVTGWTTSAAAFTAQDNLARLQNTSTALGKATAPLITTASGTPYLVRVVCLPGNQATPAWSILAGTTSGASDIFSQAATAGGLVSKSFTASGSSLYLSLVCAAGATGDYVSFPFVSVARCILVNGAAQTGSGLNVAGLGSAANGILLPGDWVAVNQELKRITAHVNTTGGGLGYMQFSPPLRVSPANSDPIAVVSPFARFVLTQSANGWQTEPGGFATYSFDFEEWPQ